MDFRAIGIDHVDVSSVDAQQIIFSFSILDSVFYLTFIYGCVSNVER